MFFFFFFYQISFQVFFRNNHFNTLFKYESHLYLLLTDIGYEHQGGYVWERLTEIDGDTMCCGSDFKRSPTASTMEGSAATSSSHDPNDPDYLLALEMQRQYGGDGGGGGGGGGGGLGGGGGFYFLFFYFFLSGFGKGRGWFNIGIH